MKLSQWHDGKVKPVHVGVYERYPDMKETFYNYFDGTFWHWGSLSIDNAYNREINPAIHDEQYCLWRGIIKDKK